MAANGLSMVLGGRVAESTLARHGLSYIDEYPWELIVTYGCHDYFVHASSSCHISEASSATIVTLLQAHLAARQGDPNVIAYWFLDDYPGGDISDLLETMHNMLAAANHDPSSIFPRPALCGFGGQILPRSDTRKPNADPLLSYFKKALTNFRPSYCDMVALYPYAVNSGTGPNDPSQYDWSMTRLLPAMFKDLEDLGWNSSKEPLVGIPQAFGCGQYVTPRESDIVTQMSAYCKAGAVALIAYSWDDGYHSKYPDRPYTEPVNSAAVRAGLASGFAQCQKYWP